MRTVKQRIMHSIHFLIKLNQQQMQLNPVTSLELASGVKVTVASLKSIGSITTGL